MSQKLPVHGYKWVENTFPFNKDFIEIYYGDNEAGGFLEVDVQHLEKLKNCYSDLPFLPETMKFGKFGKFVASLYDKKEYMIHLTHLK